MPAVSGWACSGQRKCDRRVVLTRGGLGRIARGHNQLTICRWRIVEELSIVRRTNVRCCSTANRTPDTGCAAYQGSIVVRSSGHSTVLHGTDNLWVVVNTLSGTNDIYLVPFGSNQVAGTVKCEDQSRTCGIVGVFGEDVRA